MPAMKFGAAFLLSSCCLCPAAMAAGGHHSVDDATTLDPGQCQVEVWTEQASGSDLEHIGPACRLGALEWGLNIDRNRIHGSNNTLQSGGLQLKWAREFAPGWSLGAATGVNWQNQAPHRAGQWLVVPLTWAATPEVTLHLNLGREFRNGSPDRSTRGAAVEWQPFTQWQGLLEWFDDGQRPLHRVGLRYFVTELISLDLSRAAHQGSARDPWWTVGLNWAWNR